MSPTPESLVGRVYQAALVILLVTVVVYVGWRLMRPLLPMLIVVVVLGLLYRYVLHPR